MREITREYVLEVIELGTKKHGGKAGFEKAAELKPGSIKDILKWPNGGTEIPRADRWQKMIVAAGILEPEGESVTVTQFDESMRKIGERLRLIESSVGAVGASPQKGDSDT